MVAWLLKLIPIPLGLWTAGLMASLTAAAMDSDISAVLHNGILLLTVLFLQRLFEIITGAAFQKALVKAVQNCKICLYRRFLSSPLHILYTARHGEVMEHFHDDFQTVTGNITGRIPAFWCSLLQTAVWFGFLAMQNLWIALVLLGLSALQLLPPVIVKKFMEQNYEDCRDIEGEILEYTMQAYHGFATIRLYGLKSWWQNGQKALHRNYLKIGNRTTITGSAEKTMNNLVDTILRYGSYGILGVFVLLGTAPVDTALEAIALSDGFFGAVKTAAEAIPEFAVARTAMDRMAAWFQTEDTELKTVASGEILLENVSLTHGEKQILENLTGNLPQNRIILLKGENGAGKSTLLRLITGLLLPDSGKIIVGGAVPESISRENWPDRLFYLPQEDAVYHIPAMELYEMLIPDKLQEALRIAGKMGLTETELRESCIDTLSGGERKKVFLTLAFTIHPTLMLLDEPTNSLDDRSRRTLCQMLQEYSGGVLIVTHDPVLDDAASSVLTLTKGGLHYEK